MAKKKAKASKKPTTKKKKAEKKPWHGKQRQRAQGPRSQALPGLEQVRNTKLDALCESIGEGRDTTNEIRQAEKTSKTSALREMHAKDLTVYKHAGIALIREAGEETLLVKKSKQDAAESAPASPSQSPAVKGTDVAEPTAEPGTQVGDGTQG